MIWIFCISVWLAVPVNLGEWSSAVHHILLHTVLQGEILTAGKS